jgi:mono/diheme cytochrome c family protein
MKRHIFLGVVLVCWSSIAYAQQGSENAARRGWIVYQRSCPWCHGRNGDGRGPSAHRFPNAATNFTTGVYQCRSTPSGTLPTNEDLHRSIQHGLYGTGMPAFVALGAMQIDELVEALKRFSGRFATQQQGQPIVVPPEPKDDAASVARGAQIYDRLKCANCHGQRGEGGPGAANLRNENGTPAHVTDFTQSDSLKCGKTPARIYTTLMTGMDGSPMAAYAEAITPEESWDLVHYVQFLRR